MALEMYMKLPLLLACYCLLVTCEDAADKIQPQVDPEVDYTPVSSYP